MVTYPLVTTHDLARVLLGLPEAPVALNVFGHVFDPMFSQSGPLQIERAETGYRHDPTPLVITGSAIDRGEVVWKAPRK